jgi:ATP-dependent RNA helicase RhlE
MSFCDVEELPLLKDIEKTIGKRIPEEKEHPFPLDATVKDDLFIEPRHQQHQQHQQQKHQGKQTQQRTKQESRHGAPRAAAQAESPAVANRRRNRLRKPTE